MKNIFCKLGLHDWKDSFTRDYDLGTHEIIITNCHCYKCGKERIKTNLIKHD